MADYKVTDTELSGIANAIRTKGGTSEQLVFPDGFTSAINGIPTGGGGDIPSLPSEYQKIDYLGFTGTQYLMVDVDCIAPDSILIDITRTGTDTTEQCICGNGITFPYWEYYIRSNNTSVSSYCTGTTQLNVISGNRYLLTCVLISASSYSKILIGSHKQTGSMYPLKDSRIHKVMIYRPSTAVYINYFIPCYRKSDNVTGMYDVINDVFYTNQGTGSFVAGGDV